MFAEDDRSDDDDDHDHDSDFDPEEHKFNGEDDGLLTFTTNGFDFKLPNKSLNDYYRPTIFQASSDLLPREDVVYFLVQHDQKGGWGFLT